MRVLVASAAMDGLDAASAGAVLARAWADSGHQAALVPLAWRGPELADLLRAVEPESAWWSPAGGVRSTARALVAALARDGPLLVDLTRAEPDAGPLLASAMGGGAAVRGLAREGVVGLTLPGEQSRPLRGLAGLSGARREALGLGLAEAIAVERELTDFAEQMGGDSPGAGAGEGLGAIVLALGGLLEAGLDRLVRLRDLARGVAAADLVVSCRERLDFTDLNDPVLVALARLASEAARPLIVVAAHAPLSQRELRLRGIEAAHEVGAAGLAAGARRVAATWSW